MRENSGRSLPPVSRLYTILNYTLTTTPPVYYLGNSFSVSFCANLNNDSLSAAGILGFVAWLKMTATVFCSQGVEEFLVVDWAYHLLFATALVVVEGVPQWEVEAEMEQLLVVVLVLLPCLVLLLVAISEAA